MLNTFRAIRKAHLLTAVRAFGGSHDKHAHVETHGAHDAHGHDDHGHDDHGHGHRHHDPTDHHHETFKEPHYPTHSKIPQEKNYYTILGLTSHATPEDIKDAYHKMAKQHHPDLQRGKEGHMPDAQKFRDIMEAYSVLSVRESRVSYDLQVRKNPDAYETVSEVEFARRHRPDMRAKTGTVANPTIGSYAAERMQELKEQRD